MSASEALVELALTTLKRHSPAQLLGRPDVGPTQQAAIQFASVNVRSALAVTRGIATKVAANDRFRQSRVPVVDLFPGKILIRTRARPCSGVQSARSAFYPVAMFPGISLGCVLSGCAFQFLLLRHQPIQRMQEGRFGDD